MSSRLCVTPVRPAGKFGLEMFFQELWQNKAWIIVTVVIAGILSAVYAFLVTPEYQVTSVLRPAAINELDALNRSEVYTLPPAQTLIKVGGALESYDIRLGFFRSHQHLFKAFSRSGRTLEQRFQGLNKNSISLEVPGLKKTDAPSNYIKLEMIYPKGIDGVSILNALIEYAINVGRQQIAADLSVIVKNPLAQVEGTLSAARARYEMDNETRIAQIAKDLQLLPSNREIELLNNRKSEDLLAPVRRTQARLRSLNLDRMRLKLVVIDNWHPSRSSLLS